MSGIAGVGKSAKPNNGPRAMLTLKDVHTVFDRRVHRAIPRDAQGLVEPNDCNVSANEDFVNYAPILQSAIRLRKNRAKVLAYVRASRFGASGVVAIKLAENNGQTRVVSQLLNASVHC
jgi:hypothetical protein